MHISSILHRYNRIRELGLRKSAISIQHKISRTLFHRCWRTKAIEKTAAHTWHSIAHHHNLNISFQEYWQKSLHKALSTHTIEADQIAAADAYTQNKFDILGSEAHIFTSLPWHEDFRLKQTHPQSDYTFDQHSFYQDISILSSQEINKDIKIPWELSRCHHLVTLGAAYYETKRSIYADTFIHHVSDWLDKNPYLLGIHWLCPMEVGIRAINWIWAWHYFKNSPNIDQAFWQRFTCSLYDHMHYLENNWEIFDTKTSNHYVSDLLGYLYLCWFFQDMHGIDKKRDWCIKELLKEYDKQVFDEGTDYESTTAYHCLVTEIFDHVHLICTELGIPLPAAFHDKLARMHEFIAWCTINKHTIVKIGDDDSGKIIPLRLYHHIKKTTGIHATYPEFGLSIIKKDSWHLTFRHHAYNKKQPSAHLHNDALSITLAINGIPILVDPGSYVYTASTSWRNHFRSVHVHNTMFIDGQEPTPFDDRLFALAIPENIPFYTVLEDQDKSYIRITSSHTLYSRFSLQARRTVEWTPTQLSLTDTWEGEVQTILFGWNFTFHPSIEITQKDHQWILSHAGKPLIAMQSTLALKIQDTWVADHYGVKLKSKCFKAYNIIEKNTEMHTIFVKL